MPTQIATSFTPISNMQPTYPAITKQAAGVIDRVPTEVMVTSFSDKILVTVIQDGRLAQWV